MLSDSQIERIINEGLSSGIADFVEVFIEQRENTSVSLLNGKVTRAGSSIDLGIGIRLMSSVNSVYVYSNDLELDKVLKLTSEGVLALKGKISGKQALPISPIIKTSASLVEIDPFKLQKSEYVSFLQKAVDVANRTSDLITQTAGGFASGKRSVRIVNSNGVNREESTNRLRFSFEAVATYNNEKQTGHIAPGSLRGYEFINEYPIEDKVRKCCETAVKMSQAGYAPSGRMPVVIGNGFGGVIFHEACGHALEATAVGIKSSCFTDRLGTQIASSVVTARDDARLEGEWGSYMTDDEGNESSNLLLIENGILKNYLVDELGSRRMGMKPTGCSRRQDYTYQPTSRMSNTYIANGKDTPEDIISSTESGLYCADMGGGSVDTSTGEFNFAVNEAYVIRNGKIAEPVRGATLIGKGPEILMNIDKVGNNLQLAAGVCGSISGNVPTTVGQPTIRVSSILVGGRD